MKIRTTKTSSGSTAIQVVEYINRKMVVLTHIGSARNDVDIIELKSKAGKWIHENSKQDLLFNFKELPISTKPKTKNIENSSLNNISDVDNQYSDFIIKNRYKAIGCLYQLLYDTLNHIINSFGIDKLQSNQIQLFVDLVIARIVEPESKLQSLKCLERDFAIKHHYRTLSRNLKSFSELKNQIEERIIDIAKKHFDFNFNLVFYDLTTLYFESFETDELKRIRFSKDNKSSNPQIMIALLVNKDGFPISYQIFSGNKFEGHTLMPSILSLKQKYGIDDMVIVADSAMLSDDNIEFIKNEKLGYIVAARTANLKFDLIQSISNQLALQDDKTIRLEIKNKGILICSFSKERYNKEKRELEKQIEKANFYLKNPSAAEIIKRSKFLKNTKPGYELTQPLIIKSRLLLGIKGYFTNQDNLSNQEIIAQYKNLWQVEKAFRIAKSDLKIRPVYHHKECTIKAHLAICFTALAISKYIEIKTQKSIKYVVSTLKSSINSVVINKITNEKIILESETNNQVAQLLKKLNCHTKMS